MPLLRLVHQVFFDFDGRKIEDFPTFVTSRDKFAAMTGWSYRLWNEAEVGDVIRRRYPHIWDEYRALPHAIQRVDVAKYIIADHFGGVVSDLDVIPLTHLDNIVSPPCTFDQCSRANIVANDFFYTEIGLPGLFEYFLTNLTRVKSINIYHTWKMRRVFQTTGPDFFTRYLKRSGLNNHVKRLSSRQFVDAKQKYREVQNPAAKLKILHHLSWKPHVLLANEGDTSSTDPSK